MAREALVVLGSSLETAKERRDDMTPRQPLIMRADQLGTLMLALQRRGYEVVGPTVRDGALVYDRIGSREELPVGWTDEQGPGHYRLTSREDKAMFGYAVGPQSFKKYLHPAEVQLCSAERVGKTFRILNNEEQSTHPFAFLGVRACELAAIAAQDRILLQDKYRDPIYQQRSDGRFIVAVQCTQSAATCFCASLGTGPRVTGGFDLVLTELLGPVGHRFLVKAGSDHGAEVLADLETFSASEEDLAEMECAVAEAESRQVRAIDTNQIKELLERSFDHPRWEHIARRCLTCANCTMVCPTCFCTTVEDVSDISGDHAERWRRWDSCFTLSFSYIHGGTIRNSPKARYRQWMTHKLASWVDQFGTLGCVGCGRCITWCPVGIDITEEARVIRDGGQHGEP
jgi:sulfhydrogenase subunit beta (sulfur reductase)